MTARTVGTDAPSTKHYWMETRGVVCPRTGGCGAAPHRRPRRDKETWWERVALAEASLAWFAMQKEGLASDPEMDEMEKAGNQTAKLGDPAVKADQSGRAG